MEYDIMDYLIYFNKTKASLKLVNKGVDYTIKL